MLIMHMICILIWWEMITSLIAFHEAYSTSCLRLSMGKVPLDSLQIRGGGTGGARGAMAPPKI